MTLELSPDEVAGIVDLFGALTRAELEEAIAELAYRRDEPVPEGAVDAALDAYAVVAYDPSDVAAGGGVDCSGGDGDAPGCDADGGASTALAPGPVAFPTLPEGAADLPHILDVEPRDPDRGVLARAVESRFRGDVARVVAAAEPDEIERLLDASYDLEAWGPVELDDLRTRLDDALEAIEE